MPAGSYERLQAARCRRIAEHADKDLAADLQKLAEDYEEQARRMEAEEEAGNGSRLELED